MKMTSVGGAENKCAGLNWRLYDASSDVKNGDSFNTYQERLMLSAWDGDNQITITDATSDNSHISATDDGDGGFRIATDDIYNTYTATIHAETADCSIEFTVTFQYGD